MKVEGKIFKFLPGHFYVRLLLHGVIASQSVNVRQIVSPLFFLSPGHMLVNDYSTLEEKLAIRTFDLYG